MATRKKEAVKVESNRIHDYELVLIVNPDITEEALESAIEAVNQFITGKGGEIVNVDKWGKRRLAYPIAHFLEGNYVLTRFKMNPGWSKELEANLLISDNVIRHLLVRLDE